MLLWRTMLGESQMVLRQIRTIVTTSNLPFKAKAHSPAPTCASRGKKQKKADSDCADDHPKPRQRKNIEETFPFYHLIKFKDECCGNPCIDKDFPSFDQCLYKESDKNKRKYQITWVECAPLKIQPKKICCFAKVKHPPIPRRKHFEKPDTACKFTKPCESKADEKCKRIKMPRCRPVRNPVRCHRVRWPSECKKINAPYPAFSECSKPKPREKRRIECNCLSEISDCQLQTILNRRLRQTGTMQLNPCQK